MCGITEAPKPRAFQNFVGIEVADSAVLYPEKASVVLLVSDITTVLCRQGPSFGGGREQSGPKGARGQKGNPGLQGEKYWQYFLTTT